MEGTTKGIAKDKFHDASNKLGHASEEYSHTEDGLVRADGTQWIGIRETIAGLAYAKMKKRKNEIILGEPTQHRTGKVRARRWSKRSRSDQEDLGYQSYQG